MVFDNTLFTVLAVVLVVPYPLMIVVLLCILSVRRDR